MALTPLLRSLGRPVGSVSHLQLHVWGSTPCLPWQKGSCSVILGMGNGPDECSWNAATCFCLPFHFMGAFCFRLSCCCFSVASMFCSSHVGSISISKSVLQGVPGEPTTSTRCTGKDPSWTLPDGWGTPLFDVSHTSSQTKRVSLSVPGLPSGESWMIFMATRTNIDQ